EVGLHVADESLGVEDLLHDPLGQFGDILHFRGLFGAFLFHHTVYYQRSGSPLDVKALGCRLLAARLPAGIATPQRRPSPGVADRGTSGTLLGGSDERPIRSGELIRTSGSRGPLDSLPGREVHLPADRRARPWWTL